MTETVLVTGAFGLVGAQTVRRLAEAGHRVVVTDLGTPAQRKTVLPANAEARWADLTDQGEVDRLIAEVTPTVIVHLAAVILPAMYRIPAIGRRVNVEATAALVRAAQSAPRPPVSYWRPATPSTARAIRTVTRKGCAPTRRWLRPNSMASTRSRPKTWFAHRVWTG